MANLPDFPTTAKVMVTLFIEGAPELTADFLALCVASSAAKAGDVAIVDLHFDTLLAEPGALRNGNGEVCRHESAWQGSEMHSQNHSVRARITASSTANGKRRQLEVDFRMAAELEPATVKYAELFLIRLLKRHFQEGSIAASWRADLGDEVIWYGDTQFAYNLIQPGVAGLHPEVYAGLVEHFTDPRWTLV